MVLGQPRRALQRVRTLSLYAGPAAAAGMAVTVGQTLLMMGRHAEALQTVRDARARLPVAGQELQHANLRYVEGTALAEQGMCEEALTHFEGARQMWLGLGRIELIAAADDSRANVLARLERYEEAAPLHRAAMRAHEERGEHVLRLQVLANQAHMLLCRGRYAEALRDYQEARQGLAALGNSSAAALCDLHTAEVALHLNAPALAHDLAHRAIQALEDSGRADRLAQARFYAAVAASGLGRSREAFRQMERAEEAFRAVRLPFWSALCLRHLAQMHYDAGQAGSAARLALEAARRARELGQAVRAGHALLLLATLEADAGETESAERRARDILDAAPEASAAGLRVAALHLLGRLAAEQGNPGLAAERALAATRVLERSRALVPPDELMAAWLAGRSRLFQDALRWVLERGGATAGMRALRLAEQSKARALLDLLRRPRLRVSSDREREALALQQDLEGRAGRMPALTRPAPTAEGDSTDLERRLQACLRRLATEDPRAAARWHRPPLVAGNLGRCLGLNETLVEYHLLDDELLVFVLARRRLTVHRRPLPAATLRQLLTRTRFQLDRPTLELDQTATHAAQMVRSAELALTALGEVLIGPELGLLTTRRVIIVPHRELNGVPFHALRPGGRLLIQDHEIVQVPSAAVHVHCRQRTGAVRGPALVMGRPDAWAPEIEREIESLRQRLPQACVVVGEGATKARLAEHGAGAALIHLSCHARFRSDDPSGSGIELADGWLAVPEIAAMDLPTELLVLAGCGTGQVNVTGGGDVFGLISSFLEAGAANLVTSLWPVPDAHTAEHMALFYEALHRGATPAGAMRTAALQVRARHPHPFYWAGFVLIGAGDGAPMKSFLGAAPPSEP